MRFVMFRQSGKVGLGIEQDGALKGLVEDDANYPGSLDDIIRTGGDFAGTREKLAGARNIDRASIEYLPPFRTPGKIICIGLNYVDHSIESGFVPPSYPTVFARFTTSLIGHDVPIRLPIVSSDLDYEAEMVAVIGKAGRKISAGNALDHVAGYSIFNDASIRDYQFKSPQWTVGKNFDATGPFGPVFVTADELPPGGEGLAITARLNGQVVQNDNTSNMIFSVSKLMEILSEAMTLEPGDMIVSGTPSGVGMARDPKLYMKPGDICEIEIEQIGILRNTVIAEAAIGLP